MSIDSDLWEAERRTRIIALEREIDELNLLHKTEENYLKGERLAIQLDDLQGQTFEQHQKWALIEKRDKLNAMYPRKAKYTK